MHTMHERAFAHGDSGPRSRGLLDLAAHGAGLLLVWHERMRQRRALLALDDRMLQDIGLSRADVHAESNKPFWRL